MAENNGPTQLPLDRILQQKNLESQQQKLLKKPAPKQLIDKKPETAVASDQNCIVIEKVIFSGVTKLSKSKLNKLSQEIIGSATKDKKANSNCLTPSQIEAFLNKITNLYIDAGYTTSRAYFEKYLFQTKTLYLQISEGKIKSLKLNNIKNKNHGEIKSDQSSLEPTNSFRHC